MNVLIKNERFEAKIVRFKAKNIRDYRFRD